MLSGIYESIITTKFYIMKKLLATLVFLTFFNSLFAQPFPNSQSDGKYYMINRAKIWTVSFGEGNPLFIIPGGPGGTHIGMRVLDSLYDSNMLIYYDPFGRGKSDLAKNVKEYSLQRDIDDLEELRKSMGFGKINILGHSYGTVVAQGYAIQYPENVSHLILCAPFHSNTMWQENDDNCNKEIKTHYPEVWNALISVRNQGYQSSDSLHQEIYSRVPYGFLYAYNPDKYTSRSYVSYPNKFNTELYYQMVGEDGDFVVESDMGSFDYRKDLKYLKMPILILAGRYDRVAVPWMTVKYKEYCPQAQFVLFEKSGHNIFIEEPEKTFQITRAFLSE